MTADKKPWDGLPTPIVDEAHSQWETIDEARDDARNLERQAAYWKAQAKEARELLAYATVCPSCQHIAKDWITAKYSHIEAAKKEDRR